MAKILVEKELSDEQFDDEETVRRRDEVLRRMLKTPPKPHSKIVGKKKPTAKKVSAK